MFNPRKPKYTFFKVREATELLPYIMQCLDGISRSKAKAILVGGGVRVDKKNVSQHDFLLQPGMLVLQHSYALKGSKAVRLIENGANETQRYATNTQL